MSFWKSVGEVALKTSKKVIKAGDKTIKDSAKYKEKYKKYTDEELKKILVTGSFAKKLAATAILKDRGIGKKRT